MIDPGMSFPSVKSKSRTFSKEDSPAITGTPTVPTVSSGTDIIKETQEHIKRLDIEIVKYSEYASLHLYHGTDLVEDPKGLGFCTEASLKHPTI